MVALVVVCVFLKRKEKGARLVVPFSCSPFVSCVLGFERERNDYMLLNLLLITLAFVLAIFFWE